MLRDLSWFLRECAVRDYKIYYENWGDAADRAKERALNFLAMADLLCPTFEPFDLHQAYENSLPVDEYDNYIAQYNEDPVSDEEYYDELLNKNLIQELK